MAIENTYLLGKNITLGCGFDLQAKAPLDSRQTVPAFAGLQALINYDAAYEGMIVYDEETKKTYQAQKCDPYTVTVGEGEDAKEKTYSIAFREFGINEAELKNLIASETTAAMEFKGAAHALPENPAKGDMYKVTTAFKVGEEDAKVGDSIVYDGEQWFIIPSGDDIEDTWRPVTDVDNDATLTFVAGDKLEKTVATDGTITYKHAVVDAPELLAENEQTRTYITEVETDGFGHITGYKTATENVVDTNTTYEFEGLPVVEGEDAPSSVYFQVKADDAEAAEVIYLDAYNKNEADGKFVAKEDGKSLISDDEIARLAEVDNYNDEEVRGLIDDNAKAIEDLETYVGTIPADEKYADITNVIGYVNKKAEETLAAAQGGSSETAASVKQQLDNYKSENNTRVKAVEDNVAAINNADTGILKQAKDYADGLAANYDEKGAAAGVQTALETEIAKKVDKVEGKSLIDDSEIARLATLVNYDDTQVKADIAKKADAETMTTELGKKVDKVAGYSLVSDTEIERLSKVDNYNDTVLAGRVTTAEGKITSLETESAKHALKTEVEAVDKKFENYKTAEAQKVIDDEQDRRLGVIEGDYLKAADIANFETKDNVKKVADDLATEIQNRTNADTDFETRIAALEGNFGDGEGTVEAQIAAAVKVEEDARKEAVKGVQDEVDAVEGRMDTAEGKIAALETASATHAVKTDVEAALALKADKSVVDAMYTNEQIDAAILVETNRAKGVEEGLQTQINTIMSNPDAEGAINSINEFSAYINEHKPVAEAFRTDINKNKEDIAVNAKAISDEASRADAAEKVLAGRLDVLEAIDHDAYVDADAALKLELIGGIDDGYTVDTIRGAKNYAKFYVDDVKQNLEERLTGVLDVLVVKKAESADVATKATQDADGNVISTTYAKKATTLAGYGIANAYNKDETDVAVQGAKDYADGLDSAMDERVGLLETMISVDSDPTFLETPPISYYDGGIHICGVGLYVGENHDNSVEVATKATTLAGYGIGDAYTKTETYTQEEVNTLLTNAMSWGEF